MDFKNYKNSIFKGQGGFGIVNQVTDDNGNQIALKYFEINPMMKSIEDIAKRRFIKEAKFQKQINHPNVVKIFDVDTENDPPYFTMPLANSTMLDDVRNGEIDKTNFLKCFYDIMAGLEEIHSLHIYHRDLKPANVLRFNNTYAIGDFGLISLNQTGITTITHTGMAKGSDMYTAPEITQDLKFASIQSDIYSLGCILHDFVGESNRIPCNEITESSEYGDILLMSTRKDPTRRFPSVEAFRESLNSITKGIQSVKTIHGEKILNLLQKDIIEFNEDDVSSLADFLNSNIIQYEKDIVLGEIKIAHIQEIKKNKRFFNYIARYYCEYARNNFFPFDFCDTLASRIETFMEDADINIKSEGIFALLYLGTRHNRWYVERKAFKYLSNDIDENLLKRLVMEIRVDDKKFCRAIKHLLYSINEKLDGLNNEIKEITQEICRI